MCSTECKNSWISDSSQGCRNVHRYDSKKIAGFSFVRLNLIIDFIFRISTRRQERETVSLQIMHMYRGVNAST